MEVLAPAGSVRAFKAALLAGANAIYVGGKQFGARRLAQNLTEDELRGAIRLAHDRGTKVYVTVNTLVKEGELRDVLGYLETLKAIDVDAVIVQDRGVVRLNRERVGIPMHASTQMGIHTIEGARWAKENGLERIILARELNLAQVGRIASSVDVGVEVFVHGALCYSFSGQCLFSSMVGGRSGNRGLCAQPCRKLYRLGELTGYLLSTADLFCLDALPELESAGIKAVKIEGRMRSPQYVFYTTSAYASAVSRLRTGERPLITEREKELMLVAFSRGFTGGHLLEKDVMGRRSPEPRGIPVGSAEVRSRRLVLHNSTVATGDGLSLYRTDEKVGGFEVKEGDDAEGYRVPFELPDGTYDVYKTKDREFDALEARMDDLELRPMEVKEVRVDLDLPDVPAPRRKAELSAYVSSLRTLERVVKHVDRVYYELANRMDEARSICKDSGVEFVPLLPRVTPEIPVVEEGSVMVCSVDQAARYSDRKLYGHHSMNIFNSLAVPPMYQSTASVELNREEIGALRRHFSGRLEVLAFGRVELMIAKDPGLGQGMLVDERGASFPVYRDRFGYAHVLNSVELCLIDYLGELEEVGIDSFSIDLRRKSGDLAELVSKAFAERDVKRKSAIKRKVGSLTAGHYLRGVE
ncbi:MAG: U32 family peptidase [Methanomassiliicoccales archaeon]|nr:U32 family peptidase [Methanomassiliicoccales archaeon]